MQPSPPRRSLLIRAVAGLFLALAPLTTAAHAQTFFDVSLPRNFPVKPIPGTSKGARVIYENAQYRIAFRRARKGVKAPFHRVSAFVLTLFLDESVVETPDGEQTRIAADELVVGGPKYLWGGSTVLSPDAPGHLLIEIPPGARLPVADEEGKRLDAKLKRRHGGKRQSYDLLTMGGGVAENVPFGVVPVTEVPGARIGVLVLNKALTVKPGAGKAGDLLWIVLRGEAEVQRGEQTFDAAPQTIVRLPGGSSEPIKIVPKPMTLSAKGGRFTALQLRFIPQGARSRRKPKRP